MKNTTVKKVFSYLLFIIACGGSLRPIDQDTERDQVGPLAQGDTARQQLLKARIAARLSYEYHNNGSEPECLFTHGDNFTVGIAGQTGHGFTHLFVNDPHRIGFVTWQDKNNGDVYIDGDVYIAFRGTITGSHPEDWFTNFLARQVKIGTIVSEGNIVRDETIEVHEGFWKVAASAADSLVRILLNNGTCRMSSRLIFTGHSLGGAVALCAAAMLAPWVAKNYGNKQIRIITFCAPAIGNARFMPYIRRLTDNQFLCFENGMDMVPNANPIAVARIQDNRCPYTQQQGNRHEIPDENVMEEAYMNFIGLHRVNRPNQDLAPRVNQTAPQSQEH